MKKFLFCFFSILTVACLSFSAAKPVDREKLLIDQLADPSQVVRDRAAVSLREMISKNETTTGVGHVKENDSAYWYKMIMRTDMRNELEKVRKAFGVDSENVEMGLCFGQGCFDNYRLDNSFVLQLYYRTSEPNTVYKDSLIWQPRRVNVAVAAKFTGTWTTYYVNGQLSHRVEYRNGVYDGTFTSYHPNGKEAYVQHYKSGVAEGEDRGFFYSGKLMYHGDYKNGKQEGEWVYYSESGQVKSKDNLRNGLRHGLQIEYYENGTVYSETYCENGEYVKSKVYDRSGKCIDDSEKQK